MLRSLKRIKEPPLRDEQYSINERAGELYALEKEKETLVKEVKRLGEIFFRLEEGEKKVRAGVENITTERLSVIAKISKEISSELEEKGSVLRDQSEQLDKRVLFLSELSDYFYAYARILEAEKLLNERREVLLDKREIDTLKAKERAVARGSKAKETLRKASKVGEYINDRYKTVDAISRWFEKEAEKEKHRSEVWAKTIALREKKVAAEKRALKKIEKKQDDRGIWLMDREEMLSRTMLEVEKAKRDIISKDG